MPRQSYSYSTALASRHITTHGTSTTFSSSTNPDEDWTKISDLAERRRIQNRIAQRNYRKKLKRRLEYLERRTESSSAPPPQTPAEIPQVNRSSESHQHYKRSPNARQPQPSHRLLPSQTLLMQNNDDNIFINNFERDGSRTPLLFACHTCPAPEDDIYSPYGQPFGYLSISGDWTRADMDYFVPVSDDALLHDAIPQIRSYMDTLTPSSMTSLRLPAVDIHAHRGHNDSTPHVCSNGAQPN